MNDPTTIKLPAHVPAGTGSDAVFSLLITPQQAGWAFSGLRVLELPAGGSAQIDTHEDEVIVLPLAGKCSVTCDDESFELQGRDSVFSAVTDFVYAPRDCRVRLRSAAGGRFALPAAQATRRLRARYGAAADVSVELRGAGAASRQVNNFCSPEGFDADRLIAVEVLTPGGNWSSYPPHKHDEQQDDESALEEIYYFEIAGGRTCLPACLHPSRPRHRRVRRGADRRYGAHPARLPRAVHGGPGYDLYYLNVMAGTGRAGMAIPRRSSACLGPRQLGRNARRRSTAAAGT